MGPAQSWRMEALAAMNPAEIGQAFFGGEDAAEWVDAARASFFAMRFTPARKDDRAVRSRLLLSVSFAALETKDQGLETGDYKP